MSTFSELKRSFYFEAHDGCYWGLAKLPHHYLWNDLLINLDVEFNHLGFERALDYMLNPPCKHEGGWLAADYLDGSVFVYCSLCGEEDGLEKYGSP